MKDRLYLRYSLNDLKRNWGVNTALMAILVLSAFLMATGCMVMERLLGGINQLFEEAKPPHFLQMHTGDYDTKALDDFAAAHPEIESWFPPGSEAPPRAPHGNVLTRENVPLADVLVG